MKKKIVELFVVFSLIVHSFIIINIMYTGDRTSYTPRDMDTTEGVSGEIISDTPRTPERPIRETPSTVRRNLLRDFENADEDQTCVKGVRNEPNYTSTPLPDPLSDQLTEEYTTEPGWCRFVALWIMTIFLGSGVLFALYMYFPGYMLLCLTKEILISGGLCILCIILVSIIVKLVSRNTKRTPNNPNTRRSTPKREPRRNVSFRSPESFISDQYHPRDVTRDDKRTATQISVKRTFKGDGDDIWSEFIRYFENIAELNVWSDDRKRRVLFTVLRGQAETYAYGLSDFQRSDYSNLKSALDERFGHRAMKESYVAEAKLRRKRESESFRDFGQAIEDLYRRAYPSNREYVQESSMKTFMDNCSSDEDFRLAVKRTRPKTLQDAITASMQEECIRLTENRKSKREYKPPVFGVNKPRETTNGEMKIERREYNGRYCYKCKTSDHSYQNCPTKSGNGPNTNRQRPLNMNGPRQ